MSRRNEAFAPGFEPTFLPTIAAAQARIAGWRYEQTGILLEDVGRAPKQVVVDLGYRGVDADNPGIEIIHRGRIKSMTRLRRRWLKRRQAVEPTIGHLKQDHRMNRCWLVGATGGALHTVLCAAGFNLRWPLRAIACGRIKPLFWALIERSLSALNALTRLTRLLVLSRDLNATAKGLA